MTNKHFNVTVSVWNDFHSPPLVAGLHNAGFKVTHHTTARQKAPCSRFVRNIPASAFNHLAFRGALPSSYAFKWSRRCINSHGARLVQNSEAFWGWSGCSLKGLQAAKAEGKPAILERGSTHCVWNNKKVSAEYKRLGLSLDGIASSQEIRYDLLEYKTADQICIPSRFVLDTFLENGFPKEKLFLNAYGVDYDFWSAGSNNHKKENEPFTFLWVATLMPRKGIAILLDAWRKANLKAAHLVLVGGISKSIENLLKDLPRGVTVMHFMDHAAVRNQMAKSHVYVLPSFEEGMARSVLEAGAAGLPVLITKETGATDIFMSGRDGLVVPSGDSDYLAEALTQMYKNPDTTIEMGRSAQKSVCPFTWDAYGKRAANFLESLINF